MFTGEQKNQPEFIYRTDIGEDEILEDALEGDIQDTDWGSETSMLDVQECYWRGDWQGFLNFHGPGSIISAVDAEYFGEEIPAGSVRSVQVEVNRPPSFIYPPVLLQDPGTYPEVPPRKKAKLEFKAFDRHYCPSPYSSATVLLGKGFSTFENNSAIKLVKYWSELWKSIGLEATESKNSGLAYIASRQLHQVIDMSLDLPKISTVFHSDLHIWNLIVLAKQYARELRDEYFKVRVKYVPYTEDEEITSRTLAEQFAMLFERPTAETWFYRKFIKYAVHIVDHLMRKVIEPKSVEFLDSVTSRHPDCPLQKGGKLQMLLPSLHEAIFPSSLTPLEPKYLTRTKENLRADYSALKKTRGYKRYREVYCGEDIRQPSPVY